MQVLQVLKKFVIGLASLLFASFATESSAGLYIQHWTTLQGSEIYFVENHQLPMIDISVNFPAGSAYDTIETSGLANLTHYLMTLGADGLNEETLTNRFADIGAVLGGSFDADRASFKLRTLTSEKSKALETFAAILQKPDFSPTVLAREKTRVIAGIQESETQPESIARKTFMRALYASHPYSLEESGEVHTVQSLQVEALRQFYQSHYSAKSAVIAIMGDMTAEQAKATAEQLSMGLPQTPPVAGIPALSQQASASVKRIPHPAMQAHIFMGQTGYQRGDPDFFPLYVGNYVLGGGGFVSRLTEEVREKRGLVYSVYSYFTPMAQPGPFQIGLQTKKEQAQQALDLVNQVVQNFVEKGVTEKELKAAKDNLIGGFPLRIDSSSKILEYLNMIGFYKLPLDYLDTFNDRVNAVTVTQINEAFKRRIHPQDFTTVMVGVD